MAGLAPRQTVLVTGATGFIGRRLIEALVANGHKVIALVRTPNPDSLPYRPLTLVTSLDQIDEATRIDVIINLAGEPIANGLWTPRKRARIKQSRLEMTVAVVRLIERLVIKPATLISGSAVGWYGLRGDERLDEHAIVPAGRAGEDCFSHQLCAAWEDAARGAEVHGVRVVALRIGLVLGTQGGLLTQMLTPFEFGLGGPMGAGKQWMSWITRDDLVRLMAHVLETPAIKGPVNGTAPNPVTNSEFSGALGRALRRPAVLAVPEWPLRVIAGDLARELLLGGQRVLPVVALETGFAFEHDTIDRALASIVGQPNEVPETHARLQSAASGKRVMNAV